MVALGMVHAETVRKRQMPRRHRRVDGDRDDDARALGGEARVPIPSKPGDPASSPATTCEAFSRCRI